MGAYAKVRPRY